MEVHVFCVLLLLVEVFLVSLDFLLEVSGVVVDGVVLADDDVGGEMLDFLGFGVLEVFGDVLAFLYLVVMIVPVDVGDVGVVVVEASGSRLVDPLHACLF